MPETDPAPIAHARKMMLNVIFDEAEMACRVLEAISSDKRRPGVSAQAALDELHPDEREITFSIASAMRAYYLEVVDAADWTPAGGTGA